MGRKLPKDDVVLCTETPESIMCEQEEVPQVHAAVVLYAVLCLLDVGDEPENTATTNRLPQGNQATVYRTK